MAGHRSTSYRPLVHDVYKDEAESGVEKDRKELSKLLRDCPIAENLFFPAASHDAAWFSDLRQLARLDKLHEHIPLVLLEDREIAGLTDADFVFENLDLGARGARRAERHLHVSYLTIVFPQQQVGARSPPAPGFGSFVNITSHPQCGSGHRYTSLFFQANSCHLPFFERLASLM
jgi:hypothetical protein